MYTHRKETFFYSSWRISFKTGFADEKKIACCVARSVVYHRPFSPTEASFTHPHASTFHIYPLSSISIISNHPSHLTIHPPSKPCRPLPSHSSHSKPSNTPLHLHRNHLNIAPSLDPSLPSSLDNYNITTNRSTPSSLSRSESTSPANSQLIFLPEAHNSPLKNPPSETKSTERGCSY